MRKLSKVFPVVFLSVLISSSQSANIHVVRGHFLDSPVEGINYTCGDTEGVTDSNGRFRCSKLPIKFTVGKVLLGNVSRIRGTIVTPQDLVGVSRYNFKDQKVINIARFLQSLDDDGVIDKVIKIDNNLVENISKEVDIRNLDEGELISLLEEAGVTSIVSAEDAIKHLKNQILNLRYFDADIKHRLAVNNSKGIVIDDNTGLIWQNAKFGNGNRDEAVEFCQNSNLAGFIDWRLPTSAESATFHKNISRQIDTSEKIFPMSNIEITKDGYIKTFKGAQSEGGEIGENVDTEEPASIRCVVDKETVIRRLKDRRRGGSSSNQQTYSNSNKIHNSGSNTNNNGDNNSNSGNNNNNNNNNNSNANKTNKSSNTNGKESNNNNNNNNANMKGNGGDNNGSNTTDTNNDEVLDVSSITISEELKNSYLKAINDVRTQGVDCGKYGYFESAPALKWNDELFKAAYIHSWDMAKSSRISHLGTGTKSDLVSQAYHPGKGSTIRERAKYAGYDFVRLSENLEAGPDMEPIAEMVSSLLEDSQQCKLLMNPKITEMGMAVVYEENSRHKYYWSQELGSRTNNSKGGSTSTNTSTNNSKSGSTSTNTATNNSKGGSTSTNTSTNNSKGGSTSTNTATNNSKGGSTSTNTVTNNSKGGSTSTNTATNNSKGGSTSTNTATNNSKGGSTSTNTATNNSKGGSTSTNTATNNSKGGSTSTNTATNTSTNNSKGGSTSTNNSSTTKVDKVIVDNRKGIVIDQKTGFIWQNARIGHGERDTARNFCKNLNFAGITNWRLPKSDESSRFHKAMNKQGYVPRQTFSKCVAEVTDDGYVLTLEGSKVYRRGSRKPGDPVYFSGGKANIRCVAEKK